MNDAKNSKVIRTRSETWIQPAQALFVPRSLMFQDKPLFSETEVGAAMGQTFEYVDSEFEHHRDLLFALGSRTMDVGIVNAIISRSLSFSEKSYEWIRELFQYLCSNAPYKHSYGDACFLRLATGSWTSLSAQSKVYLPLLREPEQMPFGIRISVLETEFYQKISKSRRADLFLTTTLKLGPLATDDLIKEIIRVHRERLTSTGALLDVETCLNHTQYLIQYNHLIGVSATDIRTQLQVADHHSVVSPNKQIIRDWTFAGNSHIEPCTLSEICGSNNRFSFLSSQYSPAQKDFLLHFTDLQDFPSFTRPSESTLVDQWYGNCPEVASPFYTDILSPKSLGNNLLLYYLALKCPVSVVPRGKEILFAALRQLEFLCQSGLYSPISTCYVCTTELERFLTEDMHVLQLESPNDTKWRFLKSLGVTLEPDIELFLDLLREQKKTISLTDDVENIADLL